MGRTYCHCGMVGDHDCPYDEIDKLEATLAELREENARLMGVNLDRLLRIETALHFSEQIRSKDAVVIVGEMIYALRDADRSELIEWKRERAALASAEGGE